MSPAERSSNGGFIVPVVHESLGVAGANVVSLDVFDQATPEQLREQVEKVNAKFSSERAAIGGTARAIKEHRDELHPVAA